MGCYSQVFPSNHGSQGQDRHSDKVHVDGMPDNTSQYHVKSRKVWFKCVVNQGVDSLLSKSEFHRHELPMKVQLNIEELVLVSVQIDSKLLKHQGYMNFAVGGGQDRSLGWQNPDNVQDDPTPIHLLQWYLHLVEFQDDIREGDPLHTNNKLKTMMSLF